MNENQKLADIEALARIAARVAGRNPDEHVEVRIGDVICFRGLAWQYPDFVCRAESAYGRLCSALPL